MSTLPDMTKPLVELREIRKAFGGVKAVDGVSINLYPGEVVALLGHNGAGKSTLMKMLAGAYPIDTGDIVIAGQPVNIRTPSEAQGLPIPVLIWAVVAVVLSFLVHRTRFGRYVFAMGGNPDAAALVGIPVKRVTLMLSLIHI